MFWEKWIPANYLVKSAVCGLEIVLNENGNEYNYTILRRNKDQLEKSDAQTGLRTPALPGHIKKDKIPLAVCITGKGTIVKQIGLNSPAGNLAEVVSQNLPAINPDDFIIQLFPQENGVGFLSVLRKKDFEAVWSELKGYEIACCFIGAPVAGYAIPLVEAYNLISTGRQTLEINNGCITGITGDKNNPAELHAGDIGLAPGSILSFSSAFSYIAQNASAVSANMEINGLLQKHTQANTLRILSYTLVGVFFFICLANFAAFTYFFDANNKLESTLTVYQEKYDKVNELLEAYEKKKGLIEQAGILNSNGFSQFADKIAATVPDEVVLSDWSFNPPVDKDEEDSLVVFSKDILVIKGNCNKSLIVNEWINVLKAQNFIRDVNLEKFAFASEGNQPNFEIKIVTKND